MKRIVVGLVVGAFVAWLSTAAGAYQAVEVKDGGTIAGTVKFKGEAPKAKELAVTKDKEVCAKEPKVDESLVVGPDKGVQWAVVSLTKIDKGKKLQTTPNPVLDQKGCRYHPHVLVVPVGAKLDILNEDGISHNIHTFSSANPAFNKMQPKFAKKIGAEFTKPERIRVECDIHNWMSGWIVATDHPYVAVTNEKGEFKLTDVPPGTYEVTVWQEKAAAKGEVKQSVTVKAGETSSLSFELK